MELKKMSKKLPVFSYVAFSNETESVVRNTVKASNEKAAFLQIQQLGLEPLNVKKEATSILDIEVQYLK